MTAKNIIVALLFLLSFGLMEAHRIVPPSSIKVSLFFASSEEQTIKWYVKDNADMAIMAIRLMAILISLKKSFIKSIIAIVLYFNLFGFCMYWYDYNRSEWLYGCAYLTVFFLVIKAIKQWNQ